MQRAKNTSVLKKKSKANKIVYQGMLSRFTDMVKMKSFKPAPEWEAHVLDKTMTILMHKEPEVLEKVIEAVRKHFGELESDVWNNVSEDGKTCFCPTCNQEIK